MLDVAPSGGRVAPGGGVGRVDGVEGVEPGAAPTGRGANARAGSVGDGRDASGCGAGVGGVLVLEMKRLSPPPGATGAGWVTAAAGAVSVGVGAAGAAAAGATGRGVASTGAGGVGWTGAAAGRGGSGAGRITGRVTGGIGATHPPRFSGATRAGADAAAGAGAGADAVAGAGAAAATGAAATGAATGRSAAASTTGAGAGAGAATSAWGAVGASAPFFGAAFFAPAFTGFGSSGCSARVRPSRSARRRTRSPCASWMLEEWLFTSTPICRARSSVSLFVMPSSLASSCKRMFFGTEQFSLSSVFHAWLSPIGSSTCGIQVFHVPLRRYESAGSYDTLRCQIVPVGASACRTAVCRTSI